MKKSIVLVFSLICLFGCNNANNVSNSNSSDFISYNDSFVSSVISSKNEESSSSSSSSNSFSSSVNKGEERLQAPLNKNNKICPFKKSGKNYWCLNSQLGNKVQSCNVEREENE